MLHAVCGARLARNSVPSRDRAKSLIGRMQIEKNEVPWRACSAFPRPASSHHRRLRAGSPDGALAPGRSPHGSVADARLTHCDDARHRSVRAPGTRNAHSLFARLLGRAGARPATKQQVTQCVALPAVPHSRAPGSGSLLWNLSDFAAIRRGPVLLPSRLPLTTRMVYADVLMDCHGSSAITGFNHSQCYWSAHCARWR